MTDSTFYGKGALSSVFSQFPSEIYDLTLTNWNFERISHPTSLAGILWIEVANMAAIINCTASEINVGLDRFSSIASAFIYTKEIGTSEGFPETSVYGFVNVSCSQWESNSASVIELNPLPSQTFSVQPRQVIIQNLYTEEWASLKIGAILIDAEYTNITITDSQFINNQGLEGPKDMKIIDFQELTIQNCIFIGHGEVEESPQSILMETLDADKPANIIESTFNCHGLEDEFFEYDLYLEAINSQDFE